MGMISKKKLYRLPAMILAVAMLFTSIPFSNTAYAVSMTDEQENDNFYQPVNQPTVSQNETEETNETETNETEQNQTEDNQETENNEVTNDEIPDSEEMNPNESHKEESDKEESEEIKENTIESEKTGEEEAVFSLKINNGSISDGLDEAVSKDEEQNIYTFKENTYVSVTANESEGYFEGWYNGDGRCVSTDVVCGLTIVKDTELTAKWNTSIVNKKVEDVSYSFGHDSASEWKLTEGNVFRSEEGYSQMHMDIEVPEGGVLFKIDCCASSEEDFDCFEMRVDTDIDHEYTFIQSGNKGYKTYAIKLSEGLRRIDFTYYNDSYMISEYDNCAYIKNISIEPIEDRDITITALSSDENGGEVTSPGSCKYGEIITLSATPKENYLFMGWKDADGNVISYEKETIVNAIENETYTAVFTSLEDYIEACENLIEGNDSLIALTEVHEGLVIPENGAFIKHNYTNSDSSEMPGLTFQVTDNIEGTKYLTFDIYDPREALYVAVGENAEDVDNVDNVSTIYYQGTSLVKTCSIKLYSGCTIGIISGYYGGNLISKDAYIKNLRITEGNEDIQISAAPEDKSLGSVVGGGNVAYGSTIKLKAIPNEGCEFCYWKDSEGNIVSKDKVFLLEVIKGMTYTAVFRKFEVDKESLKSILKDDSGIVKKVLMKKGEWVLNKDNELLSPETPFDDRVIEITVEIPEGKSYKLSATGRYTYVWGSRFYCAVDDYNDSTYGIDESSQDGDMRSLFLTPGTHTIYIVWGGENAARGTARISELAFTEVTGTATIKAICLEGSYSYDKIEGNVEGLGTYPVNKMITLKAPSIDGYFFYGWEEEQRYDEKSVSIHPEMTIQVTHDITYYARYVKMPENFVDDNIFTLLPEGNWSFYDEKAYTYNGELTASFTVSENDIRTLCFDCINGSSSGNLSLYVDGKFYGEYGIYKENKNKGIIPFEEGRHTVKWIAQSDETGYDIAISNIFLLDEEGLKEQNMNLSVTTYPYTYDDYITGIGEYKYGEEATLSIVEEEGIHFLGWIAPDGTLMKEPEIKVTMDNNKTYEAYFASESDMEEYYNEVIADSKYSIQFSPSIWSSYYSSNIYLSNYSLSKDFLPYSSLNATVDIPQGEDSMLSFDMNMNCGDYSYYVNNVEGYLSVLVNGKEELHIAYDPEEDNFTYNVPLLPGKNTIEWKFVLTDGLEGEYWDIGISNIDVKSAKYYTIDATANNSSYGTVTGDGKYLYWQTATLKAIPNKGYVFKKWQLNGEDVSTNQEYSVLVTENAQYTAVFEVDKNSSDQGETDKDKDNKNHTHKAGEWIVTKEATAKETGKRIKKCTICGKEMEQEIIPKYKVSFNVKGTIPLQVKKSTTAIKVNLMDGDKVKSYKSSNKKIVTVDKKGKIKAKKTGKAKITVTTKKGAKATITIKVQKTPVKTKKIKVDKTKLTLKKGKSYTLSVTKTPITSLEKISFTTSNKKVATVNKKGKIVAKKKGKANITVKCGKKKKTVKVTVK